MQKNNNFTKHQKYKNTHVVKYVYTEIRLLYLFGLQFFCSDLGTKWTN